MCGIILGLCTSNLFWTNEPQNGKVEIDDGLSAATDRCAALANVPRKLDRCCIQSRPCNMEFDDARHIRIWKVVIERISRSFLDCAHPTCSGQMNQETARWDLSTDYQQPWIGVQRLHVCQTSWTDDTFNQDLATWNVTTFVTFEFGKS